MTSKITRERLSDILEFGSGRLIKPISDEEIELMARMALAAMDSEPVAWMHNNNDLGVPAITTNPKIGHYWAAEFKGVEPLYLHAQPAPVVQKTAHSSVIAEQLANVLSGMEVTDHQRAVISCAVDRLNNVAQLLQLSPSALLVPEIMDYQGAKELYNYLMTEEEINATVNGWNACRAAMLKETPVCTCPSGDGSLRWPCPVHPGNSLAIGIDVASGPDRTFEVRYVAPPGYVMVPVEPTNEILDEFDSIIDYGAEDSEDAWRRLLAAAPQEVKP